MYSQSLSDIQAYITFLLKDKLSAKLSFHSLDHTQNVVAAINEIALNCGLSVAESQVIEIAGWFHDVGYLYKYIGHEDESLRLAEQYLKEKKFSSGVISQVVSCIHATRYPQKPTNLFDKIMCDADLYHFSLPDYDKYAQLLRVEWEYYLHKNYTNETWHKENCIILRCHRYFTTYGKEVLEKRKEINLKRIESYCR